MRRLLSVYLTCSFVFMKLAVYVVNLEFCRICFEGFSELYHLTYVLNLIICALRGSSGRSFQMLSTPKLVLIVKAGVGSTKPVSGYRFLQE